MAQYIIPQFIESEGKIISFLTFRQFFIIVGGGAMCLLFYYTLPFYFFAILSIIVGLTTAAIAFLKVNDMPLTTLALNVIGYSITSKNYTWKKKESLYPFKIKKRNNNESTQEIGPKTHMQSNQLQDTKKIIELRKR